MVCPNLGLGLPPWNSPFHFGFLDLRHSVGLLGRVISSSQGLYLYTNTEKHTQTLSIHALSGIGTHDPGFRASEDSACLSPLGYRTYTYSVAFSPQANYTDRATAACRRSKCQLLRIEGVAWSAQRIPPVVNSVFLTGYRDRQLYLFILLFCITFS
jgi:hypothetical protein